MSLVSADILAGILPCIITGGRPALKQRPIAKLLPALHGVTADPVWVVREKDAEGYEHDEHELAVYSEDWAFEYGSTHWLEEEPLQHGGWFGAFIGREYACRLAEERGYWAVMQLDDNICRLEVFGAAGMQIAKENGGLALYADVFAALAKSTNGKMIGASLASILTKKDSAKVARVGFAYSCFLEVCGGGARSGMARSKMT